MFANAGAIIRALPLATCLCANAAQAQSAITGSQIPAPKTLTIGVAAPLTGNIAHLGKAISRGVTLAVDSANAGGLGSADQSLRFALVEQDDGADPKQATSVATKLAERGVIAVVGHLNSGVSIPAAKVYASRSLAMVTPASSNPALTDQGLTNVFRVVARDDRQPTALYKLAGQDGLKRIAILTERSAYGAIIGRAAIAQAESFPLRVTLTETGVSTDAATVGQLGERVANLELDAVLVVGNFDFLKALLNAFGRANAKPLRVLATDYACTDELLAFSIAPHRVTCSSPDPDASLIDKQFVQTYEAKFGEKPHPYAATAFDAASLIIAAARAASEATPAGLTQRLRLTSHNGATGSISFDKRGDRIGAPVLLSEIVNAKSQLQYVLNGDELRAVR